MEEFGNQYNSLPDPAAEFLAREQDQLAGLEDEIMPAAAPSIAGELTSLVISYPWFYYYPARHSLQMFLFFTFDV